MVRSLLRRNLTVFVKSNGIKHVKSAPYHPASNDLVERFVQTLKQSLKATQNDGRSLGHRLSSCLLTYRTTVHATTGVAPCELLCQHHLHTRLDLLQPDPEKSVLERQSTQKMSHDGKSGLRTWAEGDSVLVLDFRQGHSWTSAIISRVLGPVTYLVETVDGLKWKRHTDQIKSLLKPLIAPGSSDDSTDVSPDPAVTTPPAPPNESDVPHDETPQDDTHEDDPPDDPPDDENPEPVRRYPVRDRRPPDGYE